MNTHTGIGSIENDVKRHELNKQLDCIEREKGTCRVEVHYKDGKIVSGNLYLPILK
jgi:hypothetical protein